MSNPSTIQEQIQFLLHILNVSNSELVTEELCKMADVGSDGSILLLTACWDYLFLHKMEINDLLEEVLISVFRFVLGKPNFAFCFCESLRATELNEDFLVKLCEKWHLSVNERIAVGLSLSESLIQETRICAKKFCVSQIESLCANSFDADSLEQVQDIVMFLCHSNGLSKHLEQFIQMWTLIQPNDAPFPFVLTPLVSGEMREDSFFRNLETLYHEDENDFDKILADMERDISLSDVIKELGYNTTASSSFLQDILSHFTPLTEFSISKLLGTITQHCGALEDNGTSLPTFGIAMGCVVSSDQSQLSNWDVRILIDTIKQMVPDIDWIRVMELLDHDGFYIPNEHAFLFLMSIYKHACELPFPIHAICGSPWRNIEGQMSFIKFAVLASSEVFTFAHSKSQLAYPDSIFSNNIQAWHGNQAWLCRDLLNTLLQMGERGYLSFVRSILIEPLKNFPEILLVGMAHINTPCNFLQIEICFSLFPLIVESVAFESITKYMWTIKPELVVRGFADTVNVNPEKILRIMDCCQNLKILPPVIDVAPLCLGLRLAALASRKKYLDFDSWLTSNLVMHKSLFVEECIKFVQEIRRNGAQEVSSSSFHDNTSLSNVYTETSSYLLKFLKAHEESFPSARLTEEMGKLHLSSVDSSSRLEKGDSTIHNPEDSPATDGYPEDVEAEANSYFHQMFSGQLTIDAVIQMLGKFKESPLKRENLIFECMIGNLFEEYRFFSKYPERQLKIAALLFGSVIKHQLVTHLTLGIALRGVLDALRKPPDSRMFVFGTNALEQFIDRLIEWPQYCNHILQISHLRSTHADLVVFIERALARVSSGHVELDGIGSNTGTQINFPPSGSVEPSLNTSAASQIQHRQESSLDERPNASVIIASESRVLPMAGLQPVTLLGDSATPQKPQNPSGISSMSTSSPGFVRASRGATSTRFGSALNIETLVAAAERRETPIEAPASETQDKISFIINNISVANVEVKGKEFTDILKEQFYPWFAQYMVMKRASIEPNFHDLYLKFLDKIGSRALYKEIVQATYENCKVLLGSELIKSSSEERSLLKNLGSWLGKLTIGRNQVLRAREIDPKSLIIEAYEKGLMIAVIPFTSKILEPCQSSIAYQPPNPWTMAILGLLAEIYSMPNLKMNLKFDIEVLFKNLSVDLKDVAPTSLLKDRKREIEGNPDFSNKDIVGPQQIVADVKSGLMPPISHVDISHEAPSPQNTNAHTHVLSQFAAPTHLSSSSLMEDEKLAALGLSDQLPGAQGLFPPAPSQSPFPTNQHLSTMPNIGTHVIINPKIASWGLHLHFQRAIPIALDRAIKEIVSNIVQRSVSIATQTTKELVLKDYSMESDETRIYNAAHLMVASLAGSLAHVTCKEPLRNSVSSSLRNTLQSLSIASEPLELAIQLATNDNLDLGCAIIEQAATDKAIQTIDGEIAQQLMRRKHRDGPTFFDASMYTQGSINVVPEALRPKPGHLSLSQQRVYEDFVRLPWQNPHPSNAASHGSLSSSSVSGVGNTLGQSSDQVNVGYPSVSGPIGSEPSSQMSEAPVDANESSSANVSTSVTNSSLADGGGQLSVDSMSLPATGFPDIHSADAGLAKDSTASSQATPVVVIGSLEPNLNTRDALDQYQILAQKLDVLVHGDAKDSDIQGVIAEVPEIILKCISKDEAALAVAQKVFKGLYENASNSSHLIASLSILVAIRDVCKLVTKELTSWVIYSDEERRYNKIVTIGLIRSELLNLAEYNVHMAKLIDGGRNKAATEFSISLIQTLVVDEPKVISELHNLVDALAKLAAKPGSSESLQMLIELVRNPGVVGREDKLRQSWDKKTGSLPPSREAILEAGETDPTGFREQVSMLFAEWYRIYELPGPNDPTSTHFVLQLHHNGMLKSDEIIERFFRILMDLSVAHCLSSEVIHSSNLQNPQHTQSLSFLAIDVYAKLVYSILKVEQGQNKVSLFSKILGVTVKYIQKDSEEKKSSFNPRPYFRLFINWFFELASSDSVNDGGNFQILIAFANAFHSLQPLKVPGFSYAWLDLVGHRTFMPKLLTWSSQKGWPYVQRLFVDLFQFLEPYLRNAELGVPVQFLYKGALRVLLVLLHDFPEFLCDYHFTFCDLIPPSCIQMRNIILSAFPRNMRLPDPSTPNLKIDLLPEIREPPRILSEVDAALKAKHLKADIDEYLKTRQQNYPFLSELKQKLVLSPSEAATVGTRYNVPLINSLVLYAGIQAIQQQQAKSSHSQSMGNSAPMAVLFVDTALDIYQTLVLELDTEGRYLFLNSIANQLRYPNIHTHYFSFVLLYLFAESNQEIIQEQITRVLLERLIVNRPHPWGLLITFIELIKNPRYNFWNRSFIRCAPEIEKLFESVARSCGGLKPVEEAISWVPDSAH